VRVSLGLPSKLARGVFVFFSVPLRTCSNKITARAIVVYAAREATHLPCGLVGADVGVRMSLFVCLFVECLARFRFRFVPSPEVGAAPRHSHPHCNMSENRVGL